MRSSGRRHVHAPESHHPHSADLRRRSRTGCVLHLSEHHGDCSPGSAIRIQTDALEALQAELHAKQYKYARPSIEEKPWSKEMTISDPFGNSLARRLRQFPGERVMRASTLFGLTVFSLAACGGGGGSEPDRYQQAIDLATQTEAMARVLAVPSPCQQDRQCGLLSFVEPTACPTQTYQIYSTVSATAVAAAAAASQQITLAQQAIALNPHPPQPCPLFPVRAPPVPVCVANLCQAAM